MNYAITCPGNGANRCGGSTATSLTFYVLGGGGLDIQSESGERRADLMTEVAALAMDLALELHTKLTVAIADAARAELAAEALLIAAWGETKIKKQNSAPDRPRVKSLAAIATAYLE